MSESEFTTAVASNRETVLRRVGYHPDAEDTFQEVAIRAFRKCETFKDEDELRAYLYAGITQELRRNHARASERRRSLKHKWKVDSQRTRGNSTDLENRLHLEAVCQELPEALRQAVLEVLLQGKKWDETGVPAGTLARALEQVRTQLAA